MQSVRGQVRRVQSVCLAGAMSIGMVFSTNVYAADATDTEATTTVTTEASTEEATTEVTTATTESKPSTTRATTEAATKTTTAASKKTKKKAKKKKNTEETKNITAPTKAVTVVPKITKQREELDKKIAALKAKKNSLLNAERIQAYLDSLHSTELSNDVLLTGIENKAVLKNSPESLEVKQQILDLAKELNDAELESIANTYTFGTLGENICTVNISVKQFSLKEYLYGKIRTYKKTAEKVKTERSKIDEEIASLEKQKEVISKTKQFDPSNVLQLSNLTVEEYKTVLAGTALVSLAQDFYDCEQKYGVNGIFIASIAGHESAWGTSRRAIEDNNLTGYGVYSDSAKGINKKTKRENLLVTTETLKDRYLTKGGSYYKGTSIVDINKSYAADDNWANCVTNNAYNLIARLK